MQLVMDPGPLGAYCACLGAAPGEDQANVPASCLHSRSIFSVLGFALGERSLGIGYTLGHSSSASKVLRPSFKQTVQKKKQLQYSQTGSYRPLASVIKP